MTKCLKSHEAQIGNAHSDQLMNYVVACLPSGRAFCCLFLNLNRPIYILRSLGSWRHFVPYLLLHSFGTTKSSRNFDPTSRKDILSTFRDARRKRNGIATAIDMVLLVATVAESIKDKLRDFIMR